VRTDGVALDGAGIQISFGANLSPTAPQQPPPALAFGGSNYLVAWTDRRGGGGSTIFGARVLQNGTVLDQPGGIVISTAANRQSNPVVAFDGTNYLVVWEDQRAGFLDLYGARMTPSGTVLDGSGFAITTASGDQELPSVAFDGSSYLVVWEDQRATGFDVYGVRVSTAGAVIGGEIAIATGDEFDRDPVVAFDGANHVVAWNRSSDVYAARVTTGGSVVDDSGIAVSTGSHSEEEPAIASGGAGSFIVWQDDRSGEGDIYGARLSQGGVVLDEDGVPITTVPAVQETPSVAHDGQRYLVAWSGGDISGARVSNAGVVLDPAGIAISTAPNDQDRPVVSANGVFLVVWRDLRALPSFGRFEARVDGDGEVLDPSGFAIAPDSTYESSHGVAAGPDDTFATTYQRLVGPPFGAQRALLKTVNPK